MSKKKEYEKKKKSLRKKLDSGELTLTQWFDEMMKSIGRK